MDALLRVLPSSGKFRATVQIVGRRSVTPSRDGSGEVVLPTDKELDKLSSIERASLLARAGTPYTVYEIEVAQVTPFRQSWTIERRYREFRELSDALLRNKCPSHLLDRHPLPPRKVFLIDDVYLDKRQKGLDAWVSQLPRILQTDVSSTSLHSAESLPQSTEKMEYEQHPAHLLVRQFLLPAAVWMLREKAKASLSETGSNRSSKQTPPSSPQINEETSIKSNDDDSVGESSLRSESSRSLSAALHERPSIARLHDEVRMVESTQVRTSNQPNIRIELGHSRANIASMDATGETIGASVSTNKVHPCQKLALVSCGSFVSEIAPIVDSTAPMSKDANSLRLGFQIPITDMNNLITLIYRDGCYSYFRASLLLRRIQQKKGLERAKLDNKLPRAEPPPVPGDAGVIISASGSATFPVRFQNEKVGTVRVEATLVEQEKLRQRFQQQFRNPMTSGPCAGCLVMGMAYVGTGLMMLLVALAS